MFTKTFFKLFPPPKFLNMKYAGLDISDDAVRCIEYSLSRHGYIVHCYGTKLLSSGIVDSGFIKNENELTRIVSELVKELKITTVKASLPEERMYLFKTKIPNNLNEDQIRQNIEFKLEENVPLSLSDAIFFFDLIPEATKDNKPYASVSVAPRELVDTYLSVLKSAGLNVISFEIQAKAIARSVVAHNSSETQIIVHLMDKKTGIYIVCGDVVCFTSTISWNKNSDIKMLQNEVEKVYTYWVEHGEGKPIVNIIISGHEALANDLNFHISPDPKISVEIAKIWQNAFSSDQYIPPVSYEDSLDYAIAAGLALP
ncbi:MAG: pilus assembly protein PilM [Patescibacteria group bacterium]